jgi:hypothetical protein
MKEGTQAEAYDIDGQPLFDVPSANATAFYADGQENEEAAEANPNANVPDMAVDDTTTTTSTSTTAKKRKISKRTAGFPSPAGCREELLDPPDLTMMTAAACSMFQGKAIRPLGFSHQGEYIGERGGVRGWTSWSHPLVARPGAGPRRPRVSLALGPPPSYLRTS